MDFTTSLIKDSRLMVSDKINYGVVKGGETITHQRQNAISNSNTSLVYNVQVPSLQTVIDRRVIFGAEFILKIEGTPANGVRLVELGSKDGLASFPLQRMMSTMTTTINSSSISTNIPDVMPALLKLHDGRSLAKYNSMCPTMPDNYFDYSASAQGANNNPLASYTNAGYDNSFQPNGAWYPVAWGANPAALVSDPTSVANQPPVGGTTPAVLTWYVKYRSDEPLLFLSPFTYSTESNTQGMYGVQNMNFQFQFGNIQRVWRSAAFLPDGSPAHAKTISLVSVDSSYLDFVFINGHPSDLLPSKNVVPYIEYPRYISALQGSIAANSSGPINSQSLSLNVVPDKLVLFVRSRNDVSTTVPDRFLPITNLSINFNNSSGIISTCPQTQLFEISAENGLCVSYQEFRGYAAGAPLNTGLPTRVALCSAPVVLVLGKDVQLVQDYIASGAIGNFNLQITGTAYNQSLSTVSNLEFVIICINSGILVIEQGVSSVYTGILTKEDVLKASEDPDAVGWTAHVRMTGAGLLDQIKTIAKKGALKLVEGSKLGDVARMALGKGGKKIANRLM
jgi:hypothetical protein